MITITLNGQNLEIPDNSSIEQLIEQIQYNQRRIAVEVNHEIVPRSTYQNTILQNEDTVEIVHAIGGG